MERNMTLDPNSDSGARISCQKLSVVIDENGNILEFTEGLDIHVRWWRQIIVSGNRNCIVEKRGQRHETNSCSFTWFVWKRY